ncbi:MAG: divalent cation tolerance protein CutA [Dehalococcoidia bacterium]|nr:divalent cation tolerance protein CutA [Dehalococcoidia bacterium]
MDVVRKTHSYEVPEIIALPVVQGNPDYLAWIGKETIPDERRVEIIIGDLALAALLNDSSTAKQVWEALPLTSQANVWGEEAYFQIPVRAGLEEDAREILELGEIAYWPEGRALCLFFGKTPAGKGDDIRAISPVNVIGRVQGTPDLYRKTLRKLERGEIITIRGL